MLIVSKFHDYYDGVARTGVDKTCVYNRNTKVIDIPDEHQFSWSARRDLPVSDYFRSSHYYRPFIVGFCGQFYIGYEFEIRGDDEKILYCEFNQDKIYAKLKKYCSDNKYKKWLSEPEYKDTVNFYNNLTDLNLFRKYHCPCFVIDYGTTNRISPKSSDGQLIINPTLKIYNFVSTIDTYLSFQRIHQFMSGVLGNKEKDIVEISEKDKLVQHGMDKWSFRNPEPPKRKQK
jgi:hypothetical protein